MQLGQQLKTMSHLFRPFRNITRFWIMSCWAGNQTSRRKPRRHTACLCGRMFNFHTTPPPPRTQWTAEHKALNTAIGRKILCSSYSYVQIFYKFSIPDWDASVGVFVGVGSGWRSRNVHLNKKHLRGFYNEIHSLHMICVPSRQWCNVAASDTREGFSACTALHGNYE